MDSWTVSFKDGQIHCLADASTANSDRILTTLRPATTNSVSPHTTLAEVKLSKTVTADDFTGESNETASWLFQKIAMPSNLPNEGPADVLSPHQPTLQMRPDFQPGAWDQRVAPLTTPIHFSNYAQTSNHLHKSCWQGCDVYAVQSPWLS